MNTQAKIKSRIIEIAQRLEAGLTTEDLINEYCPKWHCSERTIYRLVSFAKDLVVGKIRNREEVLNIVRSEAIAEDFENNLLSSLELESKLCKLAEREDINARERIQAILGVFRIRDRHDKIIEKQNEMLNKEKPKVFELKYSNEEERKILESI